MNFGLAVVNGFGFRDAKKLIFAIILINLLITEFYGQTNYTRAQFSRLSVLTRARGFENEILRAANKEGVDPNILWTIAYNETRFRPYLTSPKNAQGLMQFIPSTAARFDLINPYESIAAIRAAARYVKYLSNLFGGRIDSVLAAYNSGEGTVSAYLSGKTMRADRKIINPKGIKTIGGVPPYRETIHYVGRGLKIYLWLSARGTFPAAQVKYNLPTVISQAVANVRLIDNELGKLPDFTNAALPLLAAPNRNSGVVQITVTMPSQNKEQNPKPSPEAIVYYDARSGNRYLLTNGNRQKLPETGSVVVTPHTRPETTTRARSMLFAAAPATASQK